MYFSSEFDLFSIAKPKKDFKVNAPNLTATEVKEIDKRLCNIGESIRGGQKQVFPCEIDGAKHVVKFIKIGNISATNAAGNQEEAGITEENSIEIDEATARAKRELAIMKELDSPFLVKPGPIELTSINYKGDQLIYFTEQFIEGKDLKTILSEKKVLPEAECIALAHNINSAISTLWSFSKIHRDIKPANIVQKPEKECVLLDLGLAYDLLDISLSGPGAIPGTPLYYSPEQLNYAAKRQLDFRSDLFALGIVLYEAITGSHPFFQPGMLSSQFYIQVMNSTPPEPHSLNSSVSLKFSQLIMRLLDKNPHMRFRSCGLLEKQLNELRDLE